ncbi:S-layer homology domain-containing protein [Paenibacillus physcomitrellae]|nr:S-layer homology domain-containing protein [Paenibacillus physcomitrellae]
MGFYEDEEKEENQPSVLLQDIIGHWAEGDIRALVQRGVIRGYEDMTFRPE